jgi:hypothetical protein
MDYNEAPRSSGRDTYLTIVLCVCVGVPIFVFFNVLTSGLFLLLLATAAGIGVFGAFHYWLWGRAFLRETAGEREEEELQAHVENDPRLYGEKAEDRR